MKESGREFRLGEVGQLTVGKRMNKRVRGIYTLLYSNRVIEQ